MFRPLDYLDARTCPSAGGLLAVWVLRLRIKDSFKGSFTGLRFMNFGVWVILPDFRVLRVPLRGPLGVYGSGFGFQAYLGA